MGFTAAVSHELRTPLARILVLIDSADLPGADVESLLDQARAEVEHAGALIDEILFLSELESGKEVVALGWTNALPVLEQVVEQLGDSAARAGVTLRTEGNPNVDLPLRPRMLRIVAENLAENAIRYAGHGATFTLSVVLEDGTADPDRGRRRNRGRGRRPAAPLRALLARRRGACLSWHRPRARDREARRHRRRRHGRGARRPRPRPRSALRVLTAQETTRGSCEVE